MGGCACCKNQVKIQLNDQNGSLPASPITTAKLKSKKGSKNDITEEELRKELELKNASKDNSIDFKIDIRNLITENMQKPEEVYLFGEKLGCGSYGTVYRVVHRKSGFIRAMKQVSKIDLKSIVINNKLFVREIELMKEITHPHIIKIYEYFEDELYFYLIMEYLQEGDLFTRLYQENEMEISENLISIIMRQLLSAVCFIHDKGIVHGDIKPENILVEKFDYLSYDELSVKLADFGACNRFYKEETLVEKIGSPYYLAPEVIKSEYNEKCDIWSCGVVMFFLLTGDFPFNGNNPEEIKSNILLGNYSLEGELWQNISDDAKNLVKKLLTYDYKERISAQEALGEDWLNDDDLLRESVYEDEFTGVLVKRMKKFDGTEKLQQATLAYIVHNLDTNDEIIRLRKLFRTINIKNDGKITPKELLDAITSIKGNNISQNEVLKIFSKLDQDQSGYVDYEEFLRATIDYKIVISEKNLKTAFDKFDKDKNGKLDRHEIQEILQAPNNCYFNELIKKIDENGDGEIDFREFSKLMNDLLVEILSSHNSIRSILQKSSEHSSSSNFRKKISPLKAASKFK